MSDQDAYNAAFQLIRERQFEEALVAMKSFVKVYPGSELVLDARFWRGQVFDVLGREEEAIEAFANQSHWLLLSIAGSFRSRSNLANYC